MKIVAISKTLASYPEFPFNPSEAYPEFSLFNKELAIEPNEVYKAVRNNFYLLGYDKENYGTSEWNPLKDVVLPGTTVFIKPNLVDHEHRHKKNIWSVITHPSVVRAVADYVAIALKGSGKIIIGDNPHVDCNFDKIRKLCFFDELKLFYESNFKIACEIVDCRFWHMPDLKNYGFKAGREKLSGDPLGQVIVDVGKHSMLSGKSPLLFRGTYNERIETIYHHIFGRHEYYFSKSIYIADTYISIPKLKTHAKVGVTLNIKGLIGTISNKNCLIHWRIGFPKFGGDEYPTPSKKRDYFKLYWQHLVFSIIPSKIYFKLRNFLNKTSFGKWYNNIIDIEAQKKRMLRGAFSTNDTTWRMTVDVYNAFINNISKNSASGNLSRRFFSVVDGIIGGELDGPHFPDEKMANVIISGENLLAVDLVATRLMDLDFQKVKYLAHLFGQDFKNAPSQIHVVSDDFDVNNFYNSKNAYLGFTPPDLWDNLKIIH